MPYITREDGERFIIPSYRDVLSAKKKGLLKREILLLSSNYGEYIALQKKNVDQYEVAFSPDPGYLLGESIWHYFKRPADMIYCEVIPNTTEAMLVIVKTGVVYLDGVVPIDSIPDELVLFRTQENHFEIYLYGDIPLSQTPEEGKFAFDPSSVKSFTQLENPVFQSLPLVRAYQLQLVETALAERGIGVFPLKPVLGGIVALGLLWMAWSYFTAEKQVALPQTFAPADPYQGYTRELNSPNPYDEIKQLILRMKILLTMPGWNATSIEYTTGKMQIGVQSPGVSTDILYQWAARYNIEVDISPSGIFLNWPVGLPRRPPPKTIVELQPAIALFTDRLASVLPGNSIALGAYKPHNVYTDVQVTIQFSAITLDVLDLIGQQFIDLPFVLNKVALNTATDGSVSGSIILTALGN